MADQHRLKNLSSKIVWGLSKFKPLRDSEVGALLNAIEWFSAVAVDDWPSGDALHFPSEIESLIVFPFLGGNTSAFDRCLEEFIIECNGDIESIRRLHMSEFKKLTSDFSGQESNRKMATSNDGNGERKYMASSIIKEHPVVSIIMLASAFTFMYRSMLAKEITLDAIGIVAIFLLLATGFYLALVSKA